MATNTTNATLINDFSNAAKAMSEWKNESSVRGKQIYSDYYKQASKLYNKIKKKKLSSTTYPRLKEAIANFEYWKPSKIGAIKSGNQKYIEVPTSYTLKGNLVPKAKKPAKKITPKNLRRPGREQMNGIGKLSEERTYIVFTNEGSFFVKAYSLGEAASKGRFKIKEENHARTLAAKNAKGKLNYKPAVLKYDSTKLYK